MPKEIAAKIELQNCYQFGNRGPFSVAITVVVTDDKSIPEDKRWQITGVRDDGHVIRFDEPSVVQKIRVGLEAAFGWVEG